MLNTRRLHKLEQKNVLAKDRTPGITNLILVVELSQSHDGQNSAVFGLLS